MAFDTSGVNPAIDLILSAVMSTGSAAGASTSTTARRRARQPDSRKLHDLIKATGEYAIEAWVAPGNVTQEESRIVSYSAGTTARNFTLGQTIYSYDFFNRSGKCQRMANGEPVLSTPDADEDLQATLQHVVHHLRPDQRPAASTSTVSSPMTGSGTRRYAGRLGRYLRLCPR